MHHVQDAAVLHVGVGQAKAVGQQQDALPAGQLFDAAHHVLNRAERAGREDLLLQRLEALVELGRSERRDPSHHRPADTVGGGVQGAAVGGELLKGAHARGRAQDGDQVSGPHLLVDEAAEGGAHPRDALE